MFSTTFSNPRGKKTAMEQITIASVADALMTNFIFDCSLLVAREFVICASAIAGVVICSTATFFGGV